MVSEFRDNDNILHHGHFELSGIEISYGGHPDTERASLDIKYLNSNGERNYIRSSSIYNGFGWGINIYSSKNVSIEEIVLFNCEKYLTKVEYTNYLTYRSNLLISPRKRQITQKISIYDMVAGFEMSKSGLGSYQGSSFNVTNNWIQGGEGNGYVISGMSCGETNIGFFSKSLII